jgi:hypothetical protein
MPSDPGEVRAFTGLEGTLPASGNTQPSSVHQNKAIASAGPYRFLRVIGDDEIGQVWLAEQVAPVRRRPASNVVKAGMDTKQVIARFESEREALALIDHPAIAKVFAPGGLGSSHHPRRHERWREP